MRRALLLLPAILSTHGAPSRAESRSWTEIRRDAIVRHELRDGTRLVIASEPGAPVSGICRFGAEAACTTVPSAHLSSALRSTMPPALEPENPEHERALTRLRALALSGADSPTEGVTREVIAIATDLPADEALRIAAEALGDGSARRKGETALPSPTAQGPTLHQSSERLTVVSAKVARPRIYTGWAVIPESLDQRAALEVAFELSIRHERARLPSLLVGRSLARTLDPIPLTAPPALVVGLWFVPGERTSVDRIRRFIDGTLKQLRHAGPTAGEVSRAKARLQLRALHTWEDVELRARALGELELTAGDARAFLTLAEGTARVTPEKVRAVVAELLVDARRTTVEVYPPGWLPDDPRMQAHRLHTVAPGETLSSLAKRYGVPLLSLSRANDLAPTHALSPGDALWVPPR